MDTGPERSIRQRGLNCNRHHGHALPVLIVLTLALLPGLTAAAPLFKNPAYEVGDDPMGVAAGDLNGDGLLDLAATIPFDREVSILYGNGDLTFRAGSRWPVGVGPGPVTIEDLNGDGLGDVIVANRDSDDLSVLLSAEDESLQPLGPFSVGEAPAGLATGDFDDDGRPDLAVATGDGISVLLGQGNGTFGAEMRFLSGTAVRSIAVGDFNVDGAADLVVSLESTSAVVVLNGQGDGTFTQGFTTVPSCGGDHVAAGDVDGDGIDDVVSSGVQTSVLLLAIGDGSFLPERCFEEGGLIVLGQFDANAPIDLAFVNRVGVMTLLGSGNGNFNPRVVTFLPTQKLSPSLARGDFDGDGREDLAVAYSGTTYEDDSRTVWILAGNGDGTFGPPIVIESDCVIVSMDVGDLNGDGFDDLAALLTAFFPDTCSLGLVAVHLSNGDGTFGPALHSGTCCTGERFLVIGEIDADGRPDLVVFSRFAGQGELTVLFGNGDGTFVETAPIPFGDSPEFGTVDDFNEDGFGDVVARTSRSSPPSLSLLLRDGSGGWLPEQLIPLPIEAQDIVTGDFNGDAHRDLAVGSGLGGAPPYVLVLSGRGDGTFDPLPSFEATLSGPIAVGDFDGVGGDDLAIGSPFVLLGQADGTFVMRPRPGPSADLVVVGDFTADGRDDIGLGRRPEEPGLTVLPGFGGGTFADGLPVWGEYLDLHAGRFDALGGQDLVAHPIEKTRLIFVLDNGAPLDLDADGVSNEIDNCSLVPNPGQANSDGDPFGDACDSCPFEPNPGREDADGDGLGDPCDPCTDTDSDGFGDPGFPANTCAEDGCPADPHPVGDGCRPDELTVLAISVRDLNGDLDAFADPGEIARMSLTIRNDGPRDLSGAGLTLASADPDIACITRTTIGIGNLPVGSEYDTADLGEPAGVFEFLVAGNVRTDDPLAPATGEFTLQLTSHETAGRSIAQPLRILLDIDLYSGVEPLPVVGPDGIAGTVDDGTILENFDIDKNADGVFTVQDTFLQAEEAGGVLVYSGVPGTYMRGADAEGLPERMTAVACAGFFTFDEGNPACRLDTDFPMDWHFHCPFGATDCPNDEILPDDLVARTCVGGCFYDTPADNALALSLPNSLHMGAHFDLLNGTAGNTTHFRALQAFVSGPINLTPLPNAGDHEMSFFHIIDLMDSTAVAFSSEICADCADVQIQSDMNPDLAIDEWGPWEKLIPFQNTYDHTPENGERYGLYYCLFTPADTGADPPSPRGIRETICPFQGAWSNCGSDVGTSSNTTGDCEGPGFLDPSGTGVWVQTRFNLSHLLGQRVRIRWIGASWVFTESASSYYEYGAGWDGVGQDDGWWMDDIRITGAVREQASYLPDGGPTADGLCPLQNCDPSVGDNGTEVVLHATDLAGNMIDGIAVVAVAGEAIRISAAGSTLPGGCVDGVPEYRFFGGGALLQDWSQTPAVEEAPVDDTVYAAEVRCSSDPACTSESGASVGVEVYQSDGAGIALTLLHDRSSAVTVISWPSRPQIPDVSGYDLYVGVLSGTPDPAAGNLASLSCLEGDITQPTGGPGSLIPIADGVTPPPGHISYYLAGHSPAAGGLATLGLRSDGSIRPAPPSPCP